MGEYRFGCGAVGIVEAGATALRHALSVKKSQNADRGLEGRGDSKCHFALTFAASAAASEAAELVRNECATTGRRPWLRTHRRSPPDAAHRPAAKPRPQFCLSEISRLVLARFAKFHWNCRASNFSAFLRLFTMRIGARKSDFVHSLCAGQRAAILNRRLACLARVSPRRRGGYAVKNQ